MHLCISVALSFLLFISIDIYGVEYNSDSSRETNKSADNVDEKGLSIKYDEDVGILSIFKNDEKIPILIQNATEDFRPYIHPIVAPDGLGELTQFSPGHHTHQTGLYWGFTSVNGRDYFHNPQGDYWRRVSVGIIDKRSSNQDHSYDHNHVDFSENGSVHWQTVYEMLDAYGQVLMTETQNWSMREAGERYILDLEWQGRAHTDITIGEYDYGGLFLRMPWREGVPAKVVNYMGDRDQQAEGKQARWLDIGMQVAGRDDFAHIAIFDHSKNKRFPNAWRVDGQMGVGPSMTRNGGWTLGEGEVEKICYRFKIYTGNFSDIDLNEEWNKFVENSCVIAE